MYVDHVTDSGKLEIGRERGERRSLESAKRAPLVGKVDVWPRKLLSRVDYDCMTMKLLAASKTEAQESGRGWRRMAGLHDSDFLNNNRN